MKFHNRTDISMYTYGMYTYTILQNPYFNLFCTIADPFSGLSKPDPWGNSKAAELSWCSAQLVHYGRNCKILLEKLQGIFLFPDWYINQYGIEDPFLSANDDFIQKS